MSPRLAALWGREGRIVALVSAAHFVSHYHILLLPPVFELVRQEYGASYTEVALALTAFNVVSALLQAPAGFVVDRFGGYRMLIAGLLLGAAALCVAAVAPTLWILILAYGILGLANTVYHPADYSVLSATIEGRSIGKAFSVHTFAGFLGGGVAPAGVLFCAAQFGWRGAFLGAALLGLASALLLMLNRRLLNSVLAAQRGRSEAGGSELQSGLQLLFSPPVLRNLLFFVLLAMIGGGLQNFSVVALGALHGTPADIANIALSGYMLMTAAGVLFGGFLADRTTRHERIAACGFAATVSMVLVIGWVSLEATLLILVMCAGGFLNGIIQPSRDMIVRSVTPPGAFGKVFGFVSTGFNIGGMIAPLLFALLMDRGQPQLIFAFVAGFILLALLTVITRPRPLPQAAVRPAE